jgi:hypothetical protein
MEPSYRSRTQVESADVSALDPAGVTERLRNPQMAV